MNINFKNSLGEISTLFLFFNPFSEISFFNSNINVLKSSLFSFLRIASRNLLLKVLLVKLLIFIFLKSLIKSLYLNKHFKDE